MSDYGDIINENFGRSNPALQPVVGNIDEDPDKAQRAMDLSKATGVPSTAIFGDLEEFERQHKAVVASDIVANNPQLSDFVQSHPMVPKLANDDYGTLDSISQKVHSLAMAMPFRRLSDIMFEGDPLKRWKEGGPLGSWISSEDWHNHPFAASVASGIATPIELFFRGITGGIETAADVASSVGGREAGAMVEAEAMGLTGRGHLPELPEAYQRARPWLESGHEPLPTALPEYDTFVAKQNADDLQALKEATTDAQSSLLRERNPDLFRDFIKQHTDAEIGISGEAVGALYGDKPPAPDDGLLGWVPGIGDKLALARDTGGDIKVPLADWLAHVDPKVADALHDDIRVRSNGITAREAQVTAEASAVQPPPLPLPEAVPQVRAASALEPILSIGDRKLKLDRVLTDSTGHFGPEQGFHDFQLLDENNTPVGYVNLSTTDGKKLVVEMISGTRGLGPRDFGPALMRSLLKQIKQEFPEAESITGHRVSGMREKFGTFMEDSASPVVKLDNPKGWDQIDTSNEWRRILEGGQWERYSPSTQAYIKPYFERSLEDQKLINAVQAELARIVPQKVSARPADRIESQRAMGVDAPTEPEGIYIRYRETYPIILYALEGPDPLGVARHEAIHHLRNYGFFDPKEWSILEKAATDNKWMDEFDIHNRYPQGTLPQKLEEAIADAYKGWESGRIQGLTPEVEGIFQKLKAFFDALRKHIGQLLGKDPTWEDIFQKVRAGEVGGREGTKPIDPRSFNESLSAKDDVPFSKDYYDKVPTERRLSRTGISHPGFRWEVYDRQTGKVIAKDLTTSVGANRSVDKADNAYGGYRYAKRAVRAKELTEEEAQFLKDNNIDLDTPKTSSVLGERASNPEDTFRSLFEALGANFDKVKREAEAKVAKAERDAKEPPTISTAAIKYGDKTYTGAIHPDAVTKIAKDLGVDVSTEDKFSEFYTREYDNMQEGFLTSHGDFVGRQKAAEIAQAANQYKEARRGQSSLDSLEIEMRNALDERLSAGSSRIFERAAALGMTVDQFRRYDELIQQRHAEDLKAAEERAQKEQTREQTKQWKEDRKALRQEVASDIKQRPDVAADLFFGSGELYGKKVPLGSVKLDASALTDAQKAMLPRQYYGEHGLHPDDVAGLFGYGSGQAMLDKLTAYNAAKLTAGGMSAKDFVSRVIDIETDRQMQIKHGTLENNIMDAVKEQVSGDVQLNILHEETTALGMKAGQAPLDKAVIQQQLRDKFAQMPMGTVSSADYLRAAGKAGRQAELSLLANDPAGAFRAKQQQYYATVIANEAAKVEKDLARFDKDAKRFSKRTVPNVDQEYTNFIHDILLRVGRPVRRSIQDLEAEISAGEYKSLQDFVEGKQTFYLRELAVADMLFDPNFRKDFGDLTVDEFRGVRDSVKSLIANGRDELKISKAGQAADLKDIKGQMLNQLQQFQERQYDAAGGRWMGPIPPKVAKVLRTYGTAHIQIENLFNRWDHDDPKGVFQQYVMRDLVDAANSESAMEKRYAGKLREVDDKADLKQSVDNPLFKVPGTDQLMKFTRANLRTVMLNVGNRQNLTKLAKGYGLTPEVVMGWVHAHATKADWDWAQKMGDIFAELKSEADVMYRNLSGVAPESIRIDPVTTPHGTYPGWYYPLIAHPEFPNPVRAMMGKDALEQEGFVRATTGNGYTKARTGATYPLALDLDIMPARMKQMIHDISMRPAVVNASKIFYDKDIQSAVFTRFGGEWRDLLVPYLVDVANSANYLPKNQRLFQNVSEFMRQNIISTLVGLNPGTVLKHGPTALVQSLHEVGPVNFLKAMKGLVSINDRTGETNWQFAMSTSEELQRRHQNYVETLGGATDLLQPKSGFASLRNTIQRFSSTPVAISDLLSAVPTWLAQYEKAALEGETHGDAVYMADRAVRRAHGSVAITNRSAVMRGGTMAQWMASVYGFFNHIMNRQYELVWKSGETLGLAKEGQYREAMGKVPELTSMLFAYVLAPALIEEMVTPLMSNDNESWGKKAAKGLGFTLGASWVGVRDVANAILNKRDPAIGLMSTAAKTVTDFARDLQKNGPFSKEHAGRVVKDGATLLGAVTGVVPSQVGRSAQFGLGVATGVERPKGPWGWLTGLRYGTLDRHSKTFQEWQRHHLGGH